VGAGAGDMNLIAGNDLLNAFKFIGDRWSDLLWTSILETLKLFAAGFFIAALIALPIGIWLGHLHRGGFLAINVSNIGRALPSLAVIAILLAIVGIGFWNVAFALVILAVPVILTNAYVGVDEVDRDLVEAARGMGMTAWQILTRVEIPIALPLIFAGLRTAALYVMATTPLAVFAGGAGLGNIIANQASYKLEGVIAASILVAALAFLVDGLFALLQRYATPRALRGRRAELAEKGSALAST
jgi:osmoprotectant transport system permease protein